MITEKLTDQAAPTSNRSSTRQSFRPGADRLRQQQEALMRLAQSRLVTGGRLGEAFRQISVTAARTLRIERVSIWFYEDVKSKIRCLNLFELSKDKHSKGSTLRRVDYPEYFKALDNSRTIVADDAVCDQRTQEFATSYLKPLGISSMLDASIYHKGEIIGVVCHEHVGNQRNWHPDEVFFAGSIADMVSLAIESSDRLTAEVALRESEEKLRTMMENSPDLILTVDPQGKILFMNRLRMSEFAATAEDAVGADSIEFILPDERKRYSQALRQVFQTGRGQSFESRDTHGSYYNVRVVPLWRDGRINAAMLIATDITQRKLHEQASKDSESRFRCLAESAFEGVIIHRRGKILEANQAFASMVGCSLDELDGVDGERFITSGYVDVVRENIRKGSTKPYQVLCKRKDGSTFVAEMRGRNCRYRGYECRVVTLRDVTQSKRAEIALQQSVINFRALAENAHNGILIAGSDGHYVYANKRMGEMLGYSYAQLIGKTYSDLVPASHRGVVESYFHKRVQGKDAPRLYESNLMCANGTLMPVEVAAARTVWHSRPAVMAIFRDITERKLAEAKLSQIHSDLERRVEERTGELKQAHAQLVHAEKLSAVGKLSASIAHEFNNPLFGIRNVLERVEDKCSMDAGTKDLVSMAIRECRRVSELIKKLQDFHRPSSGVFTKINLHDAIDDVLMLCTKKLRSRNIDVQRHYMHNLPLLDGIADQIKQVILNLLNNAEEAIAETGGKIVISTKANKEEVVVRIYDNGCGIAPENLPWIFDPFFTTKAAVRGTGLGLSVSHGIIQRHNGLIRVESVPSQGTTFAIHLPLEGVQP